MTSGRLPDFNKNSNDALLKNAWRSGDMDCECMVASGMADVMDGVYTAVEKTGRETLAAMTLADVDRQLFGGSLAGGTAKNK